MDAMVGMDSQMMSHHGIGFQLFDEDHTELRRIAFSFWGCDASRMGWPHLNRSGQIYFLNRAIVAYTISQGNWENHYWNEALFVKTLSSVRSLKAFRAIEKFAVLHPYLNNMEVWNQ